MGKKDNKTVTQSGPPDWLKPYYTQLANDAFSAGKQVDRGPYKNDLYADPNALQYDALTRAADVADTAVASGTGNTLIQNASDIANGLYLDPASNPYLSATIDAAIRPVEERLFEQTLPAIRDATIGAGAYGGDRHGIAEALAMREFGRDATDLTARIAYENYAKERNNQVNAPILFNDAIEAALAPARLEQKIGDSLQSYQQLGLDEMLALHEYNQNAPFAGMAQVASLLNPGGYGTTTTTQKQGKGGVGGAVQGGLGGAGFASMLGMSNPITAGAGIVSALAGGLF